MKMPSVRTRAKEADAIVHALGRDDLTLAVGGMLAQCLASERQIAAAIEKYTELRALRRGGHVPSMALAPLTLYWNGRIADAIVWGDETLAAAREANDIVSLLVGLPACVAATSPARRPSLRRRSARSRRS